MRRLSLVSLVFGLNLLTACSLLESSSREPVFTHRVRYQEETVSAISKWYTGSVHNRKTIREVNDLGKTRLHPGEEIEIPERLVVRRDLLPKSFLLSMAAKAPSARQEGSQTITPQLPEVPEAKATPDASAKVPEARAELASSAGNENAGPPCAVPPSANWIKDEMTRDMLERELLTTRSNR